MCPKRRRRCLSSERSLRSDKALLHVLLETVNIILFPDLRPAVDESDGSAEQQREEGECGAFFPHIISTVGFAMCRPAFSAFMSINHRSGFDEVLFSLVRQA